MCLGSLRTILALADIRSLSIIQFDITSAYLHGTLKEVGRSDVKLNDAKATNVCQGEDGAEGSQTHYGRNRFPIINTRELLVVTSNDSTLASLKDAIIELLMKCPAEFEGLHAIHRGTSS